MACAGCCGALLPPQPQHCVSALASLPARVAWTLIDATILRPFGLPNSNRLVVLWEADQSRGHDLIEVSHLNFLDWQRESKTLESIAAFGSSHWPALARMELETVPLAQRGVSATSLRRWASGPLSGAILAPLTWEPDVLPPVILSHRFWQRRFGGAATVVGPAPLHRRRGPFDRRCHAQGLRLSGRPRCVGVCSSARSRSVRWACPDDQQRAIGVLEVSRPAPAPMCRTTMSGRS